MSQSIRFTLDCVPTAQMRSRHSTVNGFHMEYKAKKQKAHERELEKLLMPHVPAKPLEGPLMLCFDALMPVPRSYSQKKRVELLADGGAWYVQKPDWDNFAKQIQDAMTRMRFWGDDCQVACGFCRKRYAEHGQWEIYLCQLPARFDFKRFFTNFLEAA